MNCRALLLAILCLPACQRPADLGFRITSTIPHDPLCYTQGLEFQNGRLFESSGGYGVSFIHEVEPSTGKTIRRRPMAQRLFAEGITMMGNKLWVLSWKEHLVQVLDRDTFRPLGQHKYEGEGWGLTNNGTHLIMSNGSSTLTFRDPESFAPVRTIQVRDGGREITQLNELEFTGDAIFANIYLSDRIVRINPANGKVTGWLDLSSLRRQLPPPNQAEALNGIAMMPSGKRLLVTGKLWPRMFEIELTP